MLLIVAICKSKSCETMVDKLYKQQINESQIYS